MIFFSHLQDQAVNMQLNWGIVITNKFGFLSQTWNFCLWQTDSELFPRSASPPPFLEEKSSRSHSQATQIAQLMLLGTVQLVTQLRMPS